MRRVGGSGTSAGAAGIEALRYWALRLQVTGRALNGEVALAGDASARAAAVDGAHQWQDAPGAYSLTLGQILLWAAQDDTTTLAGLATRLRASGPDPTGEALAALAESAAAVADGRPGDGIPAILAVTHGADAESVPPSCATSWSLTTRRHSSPGASPAGPWPCSMGSTRRGSTPWVSMCSARPRSSGSARTARS